MTHVRGLLVSVAAILVTYYVFSILRTRSNRLNKSKSHGCSAPPKYPHKDPIFGLDLFLDDMKNLREHQLLDRLKERYDKYVQTFQGVAMGKTALWTNNPQNLQAIYGTKFQDMGVQPLRRDATLPFLREGVVTMDGPFWKHSRDLIRPTFTKTNVANLLAFEVHFKKFLGLMARDGSTVDLKPLLYKLFLDTSTEFFLESKRIQLRRLSILYRDRKWQDAIATAHAFADRCVEKAVSYRVDYLVKQAKTRDKEDQTPMDGDSKKACVLLEETGKETDDRVKLRSQILHILLAGHDSTAITVGNAIFHLCRHRDKWAKLRSEVLAVSDAPLTFELLMERHYLQHIIKETLRLHPVAPTDSRITHRDTILPTGGGPSGTSPILIQEGQIAISSFYALHHRTAFWGSDAAVFRPERWETVRPGWNYLPFGGGPRMFPGQQLALTEAAYVLARFAQEWESCECRDEAWEWVEQLEMTASSRNGIKVGMVWTEERKLAGNKA
ncbi:hypothetical protein MMC25_005054 [Agyrium rufum]|nr:hypothetical protein [Agyrium rufum]